MTIKNAINRFNSLVAETTNKSEIRVYRDFINILTKLESRSFTESEVQSIETELDSLVLESSTTDKTKYFKNALQQFKRYLEESFSLITKGYYIILGITFGGAAGLLFGVIFLSSLERNLGISLGISVGTFIGIIIGAYLESQANASGKLI
jgi:hypothetical protein